MRHKTPEKKTVSSNDLDEWISNLSQESEAGYKWYYIANTFAKNPYSARINTLYSKHRHTSLAVLSGVQESLLLFNTRLWESNSKSPNSKNNNIKTLKNYLKKDEFRDIIRQRWELRYPDKSQCDLAENTEHLFQNIDRLCKGMKTQQGTLKDIRDNLVAHSGVVLDDMKVRELLEISADMLSFIQAIFFLWNAHDGWDGTMTSSSSSQKPEHIQAETFVFWDSVFGFTDK